jgi:membrane-bound lytic murein transglycosylase A
MFKLTMPLIFSGTLVLLSPLCSWAGTQPVPAISKDFSNPGVPDRSPEAVPLIIPLQRVSPAQLPADLAIDLQIWQYPNGMAGDKATLLRAIDHSLQYLRTPKAAEAYQAYPVQGFSRERVIRSLKRFRQLLQKTNSPAALAAALHKEFEFYQSIGNDDQGQVLFTGYYEATYTASLVPTETYRYPLYTAPTRLKDWPQPHPTREQLEGVDGLQAAQGPLNGLELVWLRDRLTAFLIQVQGSARLTLTDGSIMTVGYAGKTNYPYTSIGKALIQDGKIDEQNINLEAIRQYFQQYPGDLDLYLPRNQSFVFFKNTQGSPAMGNLDVPVTAERSIATDNALMPPGALALIRTQLPYFTEKNQLVWQQVNRYVLDQDTGSAIKGPGRVDVFMGTGPQAEARAGGIKSTGTLYYLLLKERN